jgi:hypothetical protein
MSLARMPLDQMFVGMMSADQINVSQMSIGLMSVSSLQCQLKHRLAKYLSAKSHYPNVCQPNVC